MTATSPEVSRPAPLLGQHNYEVYGDILGYAESEIDKLAGNR